MNTTIHNARSAGILKILWAKGQDGKWAISAFKPFTFKPQPGEDPDFFRIDGPMDLMTSRPSLSDVYGWLTTFGPTDYLVKQSILPVAVWEEGDSFIKCIGTAFVVSCTGYVITAGHVLLDPYDDKKAEFDSATNSIKFPPGMHFGVLIPISPATGRTGSLFFPFEDTRCWGQWKHSPLLHERPRFDMFTDVAICKISILPGGSGHQPLSLSLNGFKQEERAFAFGYAEMDNIPIRNEDGKLSVPEFKQDLYVSVGPVKSNFPENHLRKDVPTPGPCFDFLAKVPGKMSGGPIMGADGGVVRGVVSRSFSGAKHAYGAMIGPAMHLPLLGDQTLRSMMESGNEGIAQAGGAGL